MKLEVRDKKALMARLKRAEGQVAAIRRMIDGDEYCVDVLTQIAAARGALAKVGQVILRSHVENCVQDAFVSGDEQARASKVDELVGVFGRYAGLGGK